jgi:hypothetical protein
MKKLTTFSSSNTTHLDITQRLKLIQYANRISQDT